MIVDLILGRCGCTRCACKLVVVGCGRQDVVAPVRNPCCRRCSTRDTSCGDRQFSDLGSNGQSWHPPGSPPISKCSKLPSVAPADGCVFPWSCLMTPKECHQTLCRFWGPNRCCQPCRPSGAVGQHCRAQPPSGTAQLPGALGVIGPSAEPSCLSPLPPE